MKPNKILLAILLLVILFGNRLGSTAPPFATDSLKVLIVEEANDRDNLPREQVTALASQNWRTLVKTKGGEWRLLDPDADVTEAEPWIQEAMAVKRDSTPWLLIANGNRGTSEAFPANLDALVELINGY